MSKCFNIYKCLSNTTCIWTDICFLPHQTNTKAWSLLRGIGLQLTSSQHGSALIHWSKKPLHLSRAKSFQQTTSAFAFLWWGLFGPTDYRIIAGKIFWLDLLRANKTPFFELIRTLAETLTLWAAVKAPRKRPPIYHGNLKNKTLSVQNRCLATDEDSHQHHCLVSLKWLTGKLNQLASGGRLLSLASSDKRSRLRHNQQKLEGRKRKGRKRNGDDAGAAYWICSRKWLHLPNSRPSLLLYMFSC